MSGENAQVAEANSDSAELIKPAGPKSAGGRAIQELVSEEALREAEEMEDAGEVTPSKTEVENDSEDTLPDDPEALKRELKKLRRENAKRRVDANEVKEKAKKWEEYVQSQKTDLERLTDENTSLKSENSKLQLRIAQRELADEFDLDADLAEFIVGDTPEQMRERAEKLAEKAGSKKKENTITAEKLRAGQTGPAKKPDTGADFLNKLWNKR